MTKEPSKEALETARPAVLQAAELVDLCKLEYAVQQMALLLDAFAAKTRLEEARWWADEARKHYYELGRQQNGAK